MKRIIDEKTYDTDTASRIANERRRLTVRLPTGLARRLEKIARKQGVSLNALLTRYLQQETP